MNFDKKYKRNLIIGSVFPLCVLIVTTAASVYSIYQLLESQRWVQHTQAVLMNLETVISRTKDAETGQRGYLLTGQTLFLEPYEGAQEEVWEAFEQVSVLTVDNAEQQGDIKKLENLVRTRFTLLARSVDKKRAGLPINWQNIEKGRRLMIELRSLINVMEGRERVLLEQRTKKNYTFSVFTPWLVIIASFIAIVVTLVFYFRLSSDAKQKLRMQAELEEKDKQLARKIDMVKEFAGEVADGNYQARIKEDDLRG